MKTAMQEDGHGRALRLSACVLYSGLIVMLSLLPQPALAHTGPRIPFADKAAHFILYAVYAWMLRRALPGLCAAGPGPWLGLVMFCTLYGTGMEMLQLLVRAAERSFSWGDIAANCAGAAAAAAFLRARQK